MITRIFFTAMLLTSILGPALARAAEDDRPKIGLVLSGGGARGGAHVGVLKALEELQVPIDYIAGTSMGAIIGSLYATGYNADEIEEILLGNEWQKGFIDTPDRKFRTMRKKELDAQFLIPYRVGFNDGRIQLPLGAISGQHLDQIFQELLFPAVGIDDFTELPIPFRAVATDLATGEEVILSNGSLPDAVRASMSIPGVFAPVRIDGRLLVDGGMANNLPVSVVREMGADIVIAVDISSPMLTEEQLTSVLSVTEQLTNFLTRRTTEAQIALMQAEDLLIVPDLGNFSSADFLRVAQIVSTGEEATLAERDRLAAMVDRLGVAEAPPGIASTDQPEYIIEFIEIENGSVLNDELIRSRLPIEPGDALDHRKLSRSLDEIYSLDVFDVVNYDLVQNEQGENGLLIKAIPRDWGPNYLQLGFELSNDFSGNSEFKLGAAYTRNALNSLGGEFRVIASMGREDELSFDFYQPIDPKARWFVQPVVYWQRQNYDVWDGDFNVATLEVSGWGGEIGLGRNFSTTSRVKLAYEYAQANARELTGSIGQPLDGDIDIGELKLEYLHDSLDSLWFPTRGGATTLSYTYAASGLGASTDYEQVFSRGSYAFSRKRYTLLLNYELGYSLDDAAPIEAWYRLGGFSRLSGLVPNQLTGQHMGLLSLAAYRQLIDYKVVTLYSGFTLEAGNAWNFRDDIAFDDLDYSGSVFLGAETPIGPLYLAYGYHQGGESALYLYVGNPFRVSRFD